jgi:hypothetical protein
MMGVLQYPDEPASEFSDHEFNVVGSWVMWNRRIYGTSSLVAYGRAWRLQCGHMASKVIG